MFGSGNSSLAMISSDDTVSASRMLVQEPAILAAIINNQGFGISRLHLAVSIFGVKNSVLPNVLCLFRRTTFCPVSPDIRRDEIPDGKVTELVANGVD